MPDETKVPRRGIESYIESLKEDMGIVTPEPKKEEESFFEKAKRVITQKDENALSDFFNVLTQPAAKLDEAYENVKKGDIPAGLMNVGNFLLGTAATPFTAMDWGMRKFPGGSQAADVAGAPFELAGRGTSEAQRLIDLGLDKIGVEDKSLGFSPESETAASELLGGVSQGIAGALLGFGVKKGMERITRAKELPKNVDPYVEPEGPAPIKELPEHARRFNVDQYQNVTRNLAEEERVDLGKLKLERQDLLDKRAEAIATLEEKRKSLQEVRDTKTLKGPKGEQKSIVKEQSKERQKTILGLKNEIKSARTTLEDLDRQIQGYDEKIAPYTDTEIRTMQKLLPEQGEATPLKQEGDVIPPDVDFQKGKAGGRVASKQPEVMAPGMTGSPIDELAASNTKSYPVEDYLKNNPRLREVLQKGIKFNQEKRVFDYLLKQAKEKGVEEEFRNAAMSIIDELKGRKAEAPEIKGLSEGVKNAAEKGNVTSGNSPEHPGAGEVGPGPQTGSSNKSGLGTQIGKPYPTETVKKEVKPKKRIVSEESYKKAVENIKKKSLGTLGAGIDPTLLKDYAVAGAYHFENGARRFSDFYTKMIQQFGDYVKPHLRMLYAQVKKDYGQKIEEVENMAVRESVADNLISKNLPIEDQKQILRTAEHLESKYKAMPSVQGKVFTDFKEKVGLMAKEYGAAGGRMANLTAKGDVIKENLLEYAYKNFLNPLKELYAEKPVDFNNNISPKVRRALEDRANADKYLQGDEKARKVYDLTQKFFDMFKALLKEKGYPVIEDYFSHIRDVGGGLKRLLDLKDPSESDYRSPNYFISAESRFLKERKGVDMPIEENLMEVMQTYLHSVTKELAYKDAVDYYYTDFMKDTPDLLKGRSLDLARKFLTSSIDPMVARGGLKLIEKGRNVMYRSFLWNNVKSAAQNGLQKEFAKQLMSPEGIKITNKIFGGHEQPYGKLLDAITEVRRETPQYLELEHALNEGKLKEFFDKIDTFQMAEIGNWRYSEMGGIIDTIVKDPRYKSLKSKGGSFIDIANKILDDPKTFEKATDVGRDLSSRTQISPSATYRPFVFDKPLFRTLLMFTRFKFGQLELLSSTMLKKLEGAEGLRAQNILRRGNFEDAKPVETLRAVEYFRKNIEKVHEMAKKEGTSLGVTDQMIDKYVDFLKGKESELNGVIKELEPLRGGKATLTAHWAKYFALSASISLAYRALMDAAKNEVAGALGLEEPKERSVENYLWGVAKDINPTPFYAFNPRQLIPLTILPDLNTEVFGNPNWKQASRQAIDWVASMTPGLGVANRLMGEATGKRLGQTIVTNERKNKKSSILNARKFRKSIK